MRTVKEKLLYNKNRNTDFSSGYVYGVEIYNNYPKYDKATKQAFQDIICYHNELARTEKNESSKGFMSAMRDCAFERKQRQKTKK